MSGTVRWGKRQRNEDGDNFVRFSELSHEQKLERRRQERQWKKDRERTLAYFESVKRTLDEHLSGAGDASTLVSIVDGFFVELVKLLKADPTCEVLRNGIVCRVIESALTNSLLLHSKSLLYVLLGKMPELVTSPVASYVVETLLASITQALSAMAEHPELLEAEMLEGGPGTHPGSGVPSCASLLSCVVEELSEHAEALIMHEVGARSLRSIVLVLGGITIRHAPALAYPITFPHLLGQLAKAIVHAVEEGFGRGNNAVSVAESWVAAAQVSTVSFVLQSLLRVCVEGSVADVAVRQRLEQLRYRNEPLLKRFLVDSMGCHVFQAYTQVPTPTTVVAAGDRQALRQEASSTKDQLLRLVSLCEDGNSAPVKEEFSDEQLLARCCWGKALTLLEESVATLLSPSSELVLQTGFALQDVALYAPTATHLRFFWQRILLPHLAVFLCTPALSGALCSFTRKCAFDGLILSDEDGPTSSAWIPADINAQLKRDEALGVRYFAVPVSLQKEVCLKLCHAMKGHTVKGAAQYLLVDGLMGDRGYELSRYLLHLHPVASSAFHNSFDKLRLEDLVVIARQRKGSLALQQFLRVSTAKQPSHSGGSVQKESTHNAGETVRILDKGPQRFFRRIRSCLSELVSDKYGAFVIETLYDVAGVEVKEQLVQALIPIYETLKLAASDPNGAGNGQASSAEAPGEVANILADDQAPLSEESRCFIIRKVLMKCCVEQYVHRPDDWRKMAQRQHQVQRLLHRLTLMG